MLPECRVVLAGTGRNSFLSRVEAAGVTAGPHLLQQENTASLWEADLAARQGDVLAFPQHWARFRCPGSLQREVQEQQSYSAYK